jgi:hypothetical protein
MGFAQNSRRIQSRLATGRIATSPVCNLLNPFHFSLPISHFPLPISRFPLPASHFPLETQLASYNAQPSLFGNRFPTSNDTYMTMLMLSLCCAMLCSSNGLVDDTLHKNCQCPASDFRAYHSQSFWNKSDRMAISSLHHHDNELPGEDRF